MLWKNRKRAILGFTGIGLGILLCVLPYQFWVTGALAIALGCFAVVIDFLPGQSLRQVLILLVCIGLTVLETLLGFLHTIGQTDPESMHCAAAIVLGAQVNGETPSMILRTRLDAALAYQKENPEAILFVSGGQGGGEAISEAEAMYRYLEAHGADMSRCRMEPDSHTTLENLRNTAALAQEQDIPFDRICIITSEFHLPRAIFLAKRLGITAFGYAAESCPWLFKMNYLVRELPAFLKAWVQTS